MYHLIRRLTQVFTTTLFLLCTAGVPAAFAGPAPIEPEYPPGQTGGTASGGEFPWLLSGGIVLLAIILVALAAVLWHRAHATTRRLVTP